MSVDRLSASPASATPPIQPAHVVEALRRHEQISRDVWARALMQRLNHLQHAPSCPPVWIPPDVRRHRLLHPPIYIEPTPGPSASSSPTAPRTPLDTPPTPISDHHSHLLQQSAVITIPARVRKRAASHSSMGPPASSSQSWHQTMEAEEKLAA